MADSSNIGEMAELAEGARLLSECTVKSRTEGSNPSLSATEDKRPISTIRYRPFCVQSYRDQNDFLEEN